MHVLSGNDVVMCDVDVMHAAGGYYLRPPLTLKKFSYRSKLNGSTYQCHGCSSRKLFVGVVFSLKRSYSSRHFRTSFLPAFTGDMYRLGGKLLSS